MDKETFIMLTPCACDNTFSSRNSKFNVTMFATVDHFYPSVRIISTLA
jgi:hypothetical protein